ncbi:MAG: RNA polymerase sigma factor [Planctomycetes bacterium]|nr:RNA polymerase sigma factor [Planctomycetota bacterium]
MDEETRILVSRAQQQDKEAVERLFERYQEPLRRALKKLLGARYRGALHDSEDALQDAVLSALKSIERFEYRGEGSFLAWLLKCAESEILHRLRDAAAQKRDAKRLKHIEESGIPEPLAQNTSASQAARGKEMEDRVRACLDRLPERESSIIVLRRYLGLEMEEIQLELDLPTPGAARALLSRAQAKLAALLLDDDEG